MKQLHQSAWSIPISYSVSSGFCYSNWIIARQLKQSSPYSRVFIYSLLKWLPPLMSRRVTWICSKVKMINYVWPFMYNRCYVSEHEVEGVNIKKLQNLYSFYKKKFVFHYDTVMNLSSLYRRILRCESSSLQPEYKRHFR